MKRPKMDKMDNLIRTVEAYKGGTAVHRSGGSDPMPDMPQVPLSPVLDENVELIRRLMGDNSDFIIRRVHIRAAGREGAVVFFEEIVDTREISESVLEPLVEVVDLSRDAAAEEDLLAAIAVSVLNAEDTAECGDLQSLLQAVAVGQAVLLVDGMTRALTIDLRRYERRQVEKPETETSVRGPLDAFTEDEFKNLALLRQRIRSPHLVAETLILGRATSTPVTIVYMRGLAAPALVQEVRSRLRRLDVDAVLESGFIEELTKDDPWSVFPLHLSTERPDRAAAGILDGRVAIITANTPFVLVVPTDLSSMVTSPEDYYIGFPFGTLIRLLRFAALGVSFFLPALYIAITNFHQEMLPTTLILSIASARQGLPFPSIVELLMMELLFEVLREAGIRLPRPFGQAVSIVGALIVGQAAVQAGLVSPLLIIIVAITGIASFISPVFSMSLAMRFLRFPLTLLGATLGLFGVAVGVLAVFIHVAGLRSFGVPFMAPIVPTNITDWKDSFTRLGLWTMEKRPRQFFKSGRRRMARGLKPEPPPEGYQPGGER